MATFNTARAAENPCLASFPRLRIIEIVITGHSLREHMPQADIKAELFSLAPDLFVSKWVFERTPHVFGLNQLGYISWKHQLGQFLEVDPRAILIVGSAAAGLSLKPAGNFRPFRKTSDIDLAIVSGHHFDMLWRWLRNLGSERYGFAADVQRWINDHRTRLVYWGVIATDRILPVTPLGTQWVPALAKMSQVSPTAGREIKIRLYRDFDALRAYHVSGVKELQQQLSMKAT